MLAAGTEHVAVLDGGRVCGVLSAADLLGLDARSPIALRHTILRRRRRGRARAGRRASAEAVPAAAARRRSRRAISAGCSASSTTRSSPGWSTSRSGGTGRLRCRGRGSTSAAPRGASSRSPPIRTTRSPTPTPPPGEETRVDAYFERLGSDVNAGLARCGIGVDNNGVLAGNRLWRMSKSDWLQTFDECLRRARRVAPDPRHGGVRLPPRRRRAGARRRAHRRGSAPRASIPQFMRLMARTATGFPVALGSAASSPPRRRRSRGPAGPQARRDHPAGQPGPLPRARQRGHDLPDARPDRGRRRAPAASTRDAADALREAFEVITRLRFEHHAALIAAGSRADNLIDPGELPPIARTELREALQCAARPEAARGLAAGPEPAEAVRAAVARSHHIRRESVRAQRHWSGARDLLR